MAGIPLIGRDPSRRAGVASVAPWAAPTGGERGLVGNVGRAASGIGARTHGYASGTIPCAPRGNFARVSSGMFRCAETSLGGRWLSQLASETSS